MNGRRLALATFFCAMPFSADARTICILVADPTDGRVIVEKGDCRKRVTPASTFKLALAVMGYDAGFLVDADSPVIDFRAGDPDWGGKEWTRPATPRRWLRYSVVWYSQRIAEALGSDRLTGYARRFRYGNADFSGDPGKDNGLERAWISSSLTISPVEQAEFLSAFVNRSLPIAPRVFDQVDAIVETTPAPGGWLVRGKTGSAFPRKADGKLDRSRGYGWYVGWVQKGDRRAVVVRLDQDEKREAVSGGLRARAALISELPDLLGEAGLD